MRYTLLIGFAIALAAAGAELAGAFEIWERLSIDLRWILPRPIRPMTDQIRHVDIDDGAIDLVGRWPWDRSTQADLVEEIRRAGARTIAIDVQWTEAQPEHDARLAEALSQTRCVLAVVIRSHELGDLYHPIWLEPAGQIDLQNLMEQLGRDIWLAPEAALDAARVKDLDRRTRYLRQPLEFKRAAAWAALQRSRDPVTSFAQLERLVAPKMSDRVDQYSERATLEAVWRQYLAWRTLRGGMLVGESQGTWRDLAPLPALAKQADMIGYVNVEAQWHGDGVVRQMDVRVGAEGGFVLPFGVAAAVCHMGLGAADIIVEGDEIFFGSERRLPLRNGRLWVYWPRADTDPRWLGLMRRDASEPPDAGHISAQALLDLANDRRSHLANVADFTQLTRIVLGEREWGDPLSDENRRQVRDWIEFQLGLDPGGAAAPDRVAAEKYRILAGAAGTEADRRADLGRIERYARWLEIEALPGTEQGPLRVEWARRAVEVLLESRPVAMTEQMVDDARREVESTRANAAALPVHAGHCTLWGEFESAVREGDASLLAREAEMHAALQDKLVFIGYLATGITDLVPTPIDPSTPGVVAHAVVANTVLDDRPVRFLAGWLAPLVVLALGVLCTIVAVRLSPLSSGAMAFGALVVYAGLCVWLFAASTRVLPFVAPVVAGAACWTVCMTIQAASTRRERQRITRQFKARAAGQLVDHLVTHPDELSVSGEEREVAVLFADLANFTSISEALGGAMSVATLNRYMCRFVDVLVEDGAYVNKFLGDGLMAFWSAFKIDPQQATKACRACLACHAAVDKLNQEAKEKGLPEIGLRLGLATGRAVVGDCGAPPAINDYTVIGDVVNLAARLESANKQFGTGTLINDRTRQLIDEASMPLRPLGRVLVVGQSTPTSLFELLRPGTPPELTVLSRQVVDAFAAGHFKEAGAALDELERRFGASGFIRVYRDTIAGVGEVFDGVVRLQSK